MTPMKFVNNSGFEVGDSIIVNPDIMCPDYPTLPLAGWQGWITDIYPEGKNLEIAWDSVALSALPAAYIQDSAQQGLSWDSMILGWNDILHWPARSTLEEAKQVHEVLKKRHRWDWLSDTNPGISEVLAGVEEANYADELSTWHAHLEETLAFPFEAKYSGAPPLEGTLRGSLVKVIRISEADEHYGILVDIKVGRKSYTVPLSELEVADTSSSRHPLVSDYATWFDNR